MIVDAVRLFFRRAFLAFIFAFIITGCGDRSPLAPPYQLVGDDPLLTSLTADQAVIVAIDYCDANGIDLRFLEMPRVSYDTFDGVGYWYVLYMGETLTVGSHFGLLINDSTGDVEYVPGE